MKAVFEYKCRRCGEVFDGETMQGEMPFLHAAVRLNDSIKYTTSTLSKLLIHNDCGNENGSTQDKGIADLIGYRVEE